MLKMRCLGGLIKSENTENGKVLHISTRIILFQYRTYILCNKHHRWNFKMSSE